MTQEYIKVEFLSGPGFVMLPISKAEKSRKERHAKTLVESGFSNWDEVLTAAHRNTKPVNLPSDHPCHEAVKQSQGMNGFFCRECGWFHGPVTEPDYNPELD